MRTYHITGASMKDGSDVAFDVQAPNEPAARKQAEALSVAVASVARIELESKPAKQTARTYRKQRHNRALPPSRIFEYYFSRELIVALWWVVAVVSVVGLAFGVWDLIATLSEGRPQRIALAISAGLMAAPLMFVVLARLVLEWLAMHFDALTELTRIRESSHK